MTPDLPSAYGPAVRAVIFDMDGLLLDTEGFYTAGTQAVASRYGKVFDWSVKKLTIGLGTLETAQVVVRELDLPISPQEFIAAREPVMQELLAQAAPMPGARALVEHLHRHRVPMAVATSSRRDYFELKTSRHRDWFGLMSAIVTAEDPEVRAAKPAPDVYQVAARRIQADPATTLAFEDSPFGVQAAVAAGLRVIAVPDPAMDHSLYPQASAILGSLNDFSPAAWGLPG